MPTIRKFCKIYTMSKPSDEPSAERTRFARRLRAIRVPRGFKTARGFAEELGIHENRYTRYERAEVEPDLGLLMKICSVLKITPNDLLCETIGLNTQPTTSYLGPQGFEEEPATQITRQPAPARPDPETYGFQAAAWELASELAQVAESRAALGEPEPARVIETAGRLYQRLESNPFSVMAELGTIVPISDASLETQKRVARCINAVAASLRPMDHNSEHDNDNA